MSKQGKRGRGKRPREEGASREPAPTASIQSFASSNYLPHSTSSYAETRFNDNNQPGSLDTRGIDPVGPSFQGQQPFSPSTGQPPPGKVAIPALKTHNSGDSSSKGYKKGRTPHACDNCRKAKAGCSGGQPCSRCRNAKAECVYGDGKRDKEKKRLSKLNRDAIHLTQLNAHINEALRRIELDTALSTEGMRAAIAVVRAMKPIPASPDDRGDSPFVSAQASSEPEENEDSEDEDGDAEVGSTGSIDVTTVDTDRDDIRATGHLGKASSVSWAKRTADECRQATDQEPTIGKHERGFALASYHTEDADVEYFDTSKVNAYAWPEHHLADMIVQSYFDYVHNAFPIVDKASFMLKYRHFTRESSNLSADDIIWLGCLNTIFAISAVYSHLTSSDSSPLQGHYDDHLIYCARAKVLCAHDGILEQDARVSTTCALGLLSLYYVSTCRLNRAWTICGLAIRHALALGLHVRNEADSVSDAEKEHRVRLWWSLYSLECLLNELTGRPSCISDRDISTPLPLNIDESGLRTGQGLYDGMEGIQRAGSSSGRGSQNSRGRQAATYQMPIGVAQPLAFTFPVVELPVTSSTYFIYRTQLSIISHEIVTQLYCAATIKEKWSDVQSTINRIDQRLVSWARSLPPEFDISFETYAEPDWNDPNTLPRTGLAMLFNSSRMILFRPCLCRFQGRISHQSARSMDFNQKAVKTCVHSARRMISLLSWSASKSSEIYAIPPWWNTLHHLCQALAVLMLEMAFRAQHLPDESLDILDDAKKGVGWLSMMSDQSVSARKAWEIFDSLLRHVAPMIRRNVFDMPTSAPVPPGYNYQRFSASHLQEQPHMAGPAMLPFPDNPASASPWVQPGQAFGFHPPFTAPPFGIASNPLDHATAVERFSTIGTIHGHYDEPWLHMFNASTAAENIGIVAHNTDVNMMQGQLGHGAQMGMDTGRRFTHAGFETGFGQFETPSHMDQTFPPEFGDPDRRASATGIGGEAQGGRRQQGFESLRTGKRGFHF